MKEHVPDTPELNRIKKALSKYATIQLAIVFSSVATGKADFDSDLDLAVDFGRPMELHDFAITEFLIKPESSCV